MKMSKGLAFTITFALLTLTSISNAFSEEPNTPNLGAFRGRDLQLQCSRLISYPISTTDGIFKNTLVLEGKAGTGRNSQRVSISIGGYRFSCNTAVIWLQSVVGRADIRTGQTPVYHKVIAYLQGSPAIQKPENKYSMELRQNVIEEGKSMVIWFDVSGQVLVTAQDRQKMDPRGLKIYASAFKAVKDVGFGPGYFEVEEPVPGIGLEEKMRLETVDEPNTPAAGQATEGRQIISFKYPINLSPVYNTGFKVEWDNEKKIGTVIGRFYLWQKQAESGRTLEFRADSAVLFLSGTSQAPEQENAQNEILAAGSLEAVYLSGNIVMTEGQRVIRADQIYYDFEQKKALAIDAEMRNFDPDTGIPVYIRAARLRQLAENRFDANDITLTTSEFYNPQISLNAGNIILTDNTAIDEQNNRVTKESWDAQMKDVRLKVYDKTVFYWPSMRANLERPDLPLESVHFGHNNVWGNSIETRWYLARLLGLEEPEGTQSTLALDYFSKRGLGAGIETDYTGRDHFGRILGYIIDDHGEDRLGRINSRRNLEPPRELRGRFLWQHRQFLPYNWQLTTELSYLSDEHFLESFYRSEYNVGKQQETLVHLKRIENNWGISFLGKARINDFLNQLEELPTAEFHWTGQSFLDDKLTFYSDSQISRFRQLYAGSNNTRPINGFFTMALTRNEVDLPLSIGRNSKTKIVPFVAGTAAYEDGLGFYRTIEGRRVDGLDDVWYGEIGTRIFPAPFWKIYPGVKSKTWDLDQLRHIIEPHLTAVTYVQDDSVIEQRDTIHAGISQRLQTKRGIGQNKRTVDWMRLDLDVTWVNDSGSAKAGPDRFLWNKPFIPLVNTYEPIGGLPPPDDRRSTVMWGPRRNNFTADFIWRMSDTSAVLSDMYYDMQSGVVQQFDVGFAHMRWPNLSYYLGSRYLKRIDNGFGEKGSNILTFAVTYAIDPRYTVVFSQQYDFDYGANLQSDITLIRQYHRIFWALTYSTDESLDENAVTFSLWPQGVSDLIIGQQRFSSIGGVSGY
jgi:hypothetical protein